MHRAALCIHTQRIARQIDRDRSGDCRRDHQRRRCKIGGLYRRMNASFEIPVTGKNRDGGKVVFGDLPLPFRIKRPGVSIAGGATVADRVETQSFERRRQAGGVEIIRNRARTRRHRAFDPGFWRQPSRRSIASKHSGCDHQHGIGGVGTACDRRDDYRAMAECPGCSRFVHLQGGEPRIEGCRHLTKRHPLFGAAWSCHDRLDRSKVEDVIFSQAGCRLARFGPETLHAGIVLYLGKMIAAAPGHGEIGNRCPVDWKIAASGAVFRGHICDGRAGGQR